MKKKKISFQTMFNIVSAVFILTCCIFYGSRFVKLYTENEKKMVVEANFLGKILRERNVDTLKKYDEEYYFNGDVNNNYVKYSGLLWRVIKVDENNFVTLISDNSLTSLAFGTEKNYENSYVNKWLSSSDDDYSGILERNLNNIDNYLYNIDVCTDSIDSVNNTDCSSYSNNYFIASLSLKDYINAGASNSFINDGENFYTSFTTSEGMVWYINKDGKLTTDIGDKFYGVKPVIKFKNTVEIISGNGTKEDPYIVESDFGLFGSYVNLNDDIWRVIDVNDELIKLMYTDYLKDGEDYISYKYSIYNNTYDVNKKDTLAYYLNNTYLNSLEYNDLIVSRGYSNGYYGKENDYDYALTLDNKVKAKVGLISIGDVIINIDLKDYFTMTLSSKKDNFVYTIQDNNSIQSKYITSLSYIVPVITINKVDFEGTGTINAPLKVVNVDE